MAISGAGVFLRLWGSFSGGGFLGCSDFALFPAPATYLNPSRPGAPALWGHWQQSWPGNKAFEMKEGFFENRASGEELHKVLASRSPMPKEQATFMRVKGNEPKQAAWHLEETDSPWVSARGHWGSFESNSPSNTKGPDLRTPPQALLRPPLLRGQLPK